MQNNTNLYCENGLQEYIRVIQESTVIESEAIEIFIKNPYSWARIVTHIFETTVKGNINSTNNFSTYIANCTLVQFLTILRDNGLIITGEKNMLVFSGKDNIEDILLDALFYLRL